MSEQRIGSDSHGRMWHVLEREVSNSIVLYYTKDDDQAHYVVWDSLDRDADREAADLAQLRAAVGRLEGALAMCERMANEIASYSTGVVLNDVAEIYKMAAAALAADGERGTG
jgi:hypothetical protein